MGYGACYDDYLQRGPSCHYADDIKTRSFERFNTPNKKKNEEGIQPNISSLNPDFLLFPYSSSGSLTGSECAIVIPVIIYGVIRKIP